MGLDTKTYWLTDRQLQCNFDFEEYFSPKGAAVQRGLESGNRGIAIVRFPYQETSSDDTAYRKHLKCALVICKVCKLAILL
jgi:hypothetical protein